MRLFLNVRQRIICTLEPVSSERLVERVLGIYEQATLTFDKDFGRKLHIYH